MGQPGIEVERLEALDPLEVSLPGAVLNNRMWNGTTQEIARGVFEQLPGADGAGYRSEILAATARHILVSGGQPPAGGRGDVGLAVLRVERLLAAGGAGDAFDLLERTPGVNRVPQLARWHAELGFATGNAERACRTADSRLEGRDTAYWLRVRAYCLALQGQGAAAELTAELARASSENEAFDDRLFALTLDTPLARNTPPAMTGLEWAMSLHLAERGLGEPRLADTAPAWLKAEAHDAMRSHEPAADPAAVMQTISGLSGRERHMALAGVLAQGQDRELAGRALGMMLADAGAARFVHVARHHGREINTIPVTEKTLEHGYELALAALIVGDLRLARRWRDALADGPPRPATPVLVAQGAVEGTVTDAPDLLAVEPAPEWVPPSPRRMVALDLAIAVAADEMSGGAFEAVLAAWQESNGTAVLPEMLALSRLGAPVPASLRADLLAIATPSPVTHLAALDAAVRAGARAESAMLAVAVLQQEGSQGDALAFASALAALDASGLRRDARYLLLERIVTRTR